MSGQALRLLVCVSWVCSLLALQNQSLPRALDVDAFVQSLRARFESSFQEQCSKYPFVKRHEELIKNPPGRYLWFVVHEKGQPPRATGGLGDRLAGLITAAAYALRSNRTLLIDSIDPFGLLFAPLLPAGMDAAQAQAITYRNWSWSGWKKQFAGPMHWERCITPHKSRTACALDRTDDQKAQAIKYYSNRSYLCRWLAKRGQLGIADELRDFGITLGTNFYEAAGCLLRVALNPSELLWKELRNLLEQANTEKLQFFEDSRLIGMHYRCGDTSFLQNGAQKINPKCYFTSNETWKGIDVSSTSPVDVARCANRLVGGADRNIFNIASDNVFSSDQIKEHLHSNRFLSMPKSCHIDKSDAREECTTSTITQWLLLALSDFLVTQPARKTSEYKEPWRALFADPPEMLEKLQGSKVFERSPVSAFSRTAVMYGLQNKQLYYGDDCREVNTTSVSYVTYGNWICQPRVFY